MIFLVLSEYSINMDVIKDYLWPKSTQLKLSYDTFICNTFKNKKIKEVYLFLDCDMFIILVYI